VTTSRSRRLTAALLAALFLTSLAPAAPMSGNPGNKPIQTKVRELTHAVQREHVFELPIDATHIAVHWPGQPNADVEVAFSDDGETFGDAHEVEVDEVGEARQNGRTYGTVMVVNGAKAVRVTTDRPLPQVSVLVMDSSAPAGEAAFGFGATAAAAPSQPPVISRAGWGANESLRFDSSGKEIWSRQFFPVQKLVVHHTAGRNDDPNPAATVRSIYYYHAVTQGWGDIGYNFMIDEAGRVYEGRYSRAYPSGSYPTGTDTQGRGVVGGHARLYNAGTVGVSLLGNFESRAPTSAARQSLVRTLAWLAHLHSVYPRGATPYVNPINGDTRTFANIGAHRDVSSTACPGQRLYAQLPAVRDAVARELLWRHAGADRYAAAANLSRASFPADGPVVYVATGANFPDALGAGPAAARHRGPVLLVQRNSIPAATAAELQRIRPQRIVIAGGTASVSSAVATQLAAYQRGGGVSRLGGADRYEAAAAISRATFNPGVPVAFVATGHNYPDALAGTGAAARRGGPILLVTRDTIPAATRAELQRLGPGQIMVLGGPASVSDGVRSALNAYTNGSVGRVSGADRYAVAAGVSATFFPRNVPVVYVATGERFPDALGAGPVAGIRGGPVLLVRQNSIPATTATELSRLRPLRIVIVGGTTSVSPSVEQMLRGYAGG
jgi:putative cell wall-binding protein